MKKRRLVKFLLTGGSAAAVEYVVFFVLVNFAANAVIAHAVSFSCGFAVSFLLNKTWVFGVQGNTGRQLMVYLWLAAFNLAVGSLLMWVAVDRLGLQEFWAKFIIMGMVAAWNYPLFSLIVFRSKSRE